MFPINLNRPLRSVTDRIRSVRMVLWAIETHGLRLIEILGDTFSPLLEEGQAMPFEAQLALVKKRLTLIRDRLIAAESSLGRGLVGLGAALVIFGATLFAARWFARSRPGSG